MLKNRTGESQSRIKTERQIKIRAEPKRKIKKALKAEANTIKERQMVENYLDIITNMENYVDGIIVIDENANIIYINQFKADYTPIDEKSAIGKNLFSIYPELNPNESTMMKALKTGEVTLGNRETLIAKDGTVIEVLDDTFPVKENGRIVGAVNVATFLDEQSERRGLNINRSMPKPVRELYEISDIIGRNSKIQLVRSQIQRVSRTNSSVLIFGVTGTGKELVAQSIHSASDRSKKPFISQNCAAIPANLLESMFFGTTKGAFTGAENKSGIFENANGGTVFLDEINSMDVNLQAKLLRVLEEQAISRVGSTEKIHVDVRVIAAVNKPPAECIKNSTMRPDLFYRLGSVMIELPQLKERRDDIELLSAYFLSHFNDKFDKNVKLISPQVMEVFMTYDWPGNVRELRNAIECGFNLCESNTITLNDIPAYIVNDMKNSEAGESLSISDASKDPYAENTIVWKGSLKDTLDDAEANIIRRAIRMHETLTDAADFLGITRQTLNQKMKKYELK